MQNKQIYISAIVLLFLFAACTQSAGATGADAQAGGLNSFLIPAFIGALGYAFKVLFETFTEWRKRKQDQVEQQLKNFYWPILTRMEQNEAIWKLILDQGKKTSHVEKKIGAYVKENLILKNHQEIMAIIINYRYLAKFDNDLSKHLNEYFKHVAIYEGILRSEEKENVFPANLGAPYPIELYHLIRKRTVDLQKKLDKQVDRII